MSNMPVCICIPTTEDKGTDSRVSEHFYTPARYVEDPGAGLDTRSVERISRAGGEPPWLRDLRLTALEAFENLAMPGEWAPAELGELDLDALNLFQQLDAPEAGGTGNWDRVPEAARETLERLNLRKEEETFLGGLSAQFDSSIAFKSLNEDLAGMGVVFTDSVSGLRDHPDLFRDAFGSLVPYDSNKLAALNTALFSGGASSMCPRE